MTVDPLVITTEMYRQHEWLCLPELINLVTIANWSRSLIGILARSALVKSLKDRYIFFGSLHKANSPFWLQGTKHTRCDAGYYCLATRLHHQLEQLSSCER
jgi:hypothetical protein